MNGWGSKSSVLPFKTQGNQTFGWDILGLCWDIPELSEKFENKVCVQFVAPAVDYPRGARDGALHREIGLNTL